MKINGLTIPHPVVFRKAPRHEQRAAAAPSFARVKATVTHQPAAPKALYAMPVVAVVAGIASIVGGVAAVGAATSVVAMVVAGAMVVGGAMMVVGTIADKPNLVKWGGILSLAGTLGTGLIGAMGSEAATVAGEVASDSGALVDVPPGAPSEVPIPDASGATQLSGPGMSGAPPAPTPAPAQPTGLLTEPPATPPAPPPEAPPAATAQPAPLAPTTPAAPNTMSPGGPNTFRTVDVPGNLPLNSGAADNSSFITKLETWAKANPELARGAFSGASGLLGSAVPKPTTEYEAAAANAANTRAEVEARRYGLKPGWWTRLPAGG